MHGLNLGEIMPNVSKRGPIKEYKIHNLGDAMCHIRPLRGIQYAKRNQAREENYTQCHQKVKKTLNEVKILHYEP
jgi:hypothetical protein